jgi:hypothetical protein
MQQPIHSSNNLPEYNKVFKKTIIPQDRPGRNYYDANNIGFTDDLDNICADTIVIDSSSRNWDKEDTNNYTIFLGETFNYVHSIELIDGYIPASGYMVTEQNNTLVFKEDDEQLNYATVPVGNYDIKSLLKKLTSSLNDTSPNNYVYECKFKGATNKVTIECDHEFELIFTDSTEVVGDRGYMETLVINPVTNRKEIQRVEVSNSRQKYVRNSIGKLIGFKPINLENSKYYTGQMVYDLHPYNYLGMFLNTENADSFGNITAPSPDKGADDAFAVVSLTRGCYTFNRVVDNGRFKMNFNPPIHFNKLRLQFRTVDGNLYDFNGVDHFLIFEVKRAFNKEAITSLKNLS